METYPELSEEICEKCLSTPERTEYYLGKFYVTAQAYAHDLAIVMVNTLTRLQIWRREVSGLWTAGARPKDCL